MPAAVPHCLTTMSPLWTRSLEAAGGALRGVAARRCRCALQLAEMDRRTRQVQRMVARVHARGGSEGRPAVSHGRYFGPNDADALLEAIGVCRAPGMSGPELCQGGAAAASRYPLAAPLTSGYVGQEGVPSDLPFVPKPWRVDQVARPGSKELLSSIASYNLIGVQAERDADNLRRNLNEELGANRIAAPAAEGNGHNTRIESFPIGIDVSEFQKVAARSGSSRLVRQTSSGLGSRKLIIGVDRLDYSKGIPERMAAYERFLLDNFDQRGRVTYLQIAPTSRSEVPEYAAVSHAVNEALGRINGSLGEPGWVPIDYVTSTYPRSVLAGLYRLASVGLVTPMRDGMNLVAKEYVAAQDPTDPGVLVLSNLPGRRSSSRQL